MSRALWGGGHISALPNLQANRTQRREWTVTTSCGKSYENESGGGPGLLMAVASWESDFSHEDLQGDQANGDEDGAKGTASGS